MMLYALAGLLGLGAGYWAVFVTIAAEQFGTNLRSTVATTVPNFVRGAVPLITSSFVYLKGPLGFVASAAVVGAACGGCRWLVVEELRWESRMELRT